MKLFNYFLIKQLELLNNHRLIDKPEINFQKINEDHLSRIITLLLLEVYHSYEQQNSSAKDR